MRKLLFVITLAALVLLFAPSSAFGQQKCQDFRALYHMTLWVNLVTGEGAWYMDTEDPIHGLLDQQPVTPTIEYGPDDPMTSRWTGVVGHDRGGTTIWNFGDGNTFSVADWHATYPNQPGKAGMWQYNGTGKIVGGTGTFAGATGTATETGPYMVWPTMKDGIPWLTGKYHATIVTRVCKQ